MKSFKDLRITTEQSDFKGFKGDKIDAKKILNIEVEIHGYKKGPSKYYAGQICLQLQIKHRDEMRVVFLQGKKLEDILGRVAPQDFPFKATLTHNDWYDFE